MDKTVIDLYSYNSKLKIGTMFTDGVPHGGSLLSFQGKSYDVRYVWLVDFKDANAKSCACVQVEVVELNEVAQAPMYWGKS
jgi:hypothetical protein